MYDKVNFENLKIKTVNEALNWFENDSNFESKFRVSLESSKTFKIKDDEKMRVKIHEYTKKYRQSSQHENIKPTDYNIDDFFEADSSPFAWVHYTDYYTNILEKQSGDEYKISEPFWQKVKKDDSYCFYKFHAITGDKRTRYKENNDYACPTTQTSLSGDCDFNFNNDKCHKLLKKLLDENQYNELKQAVDKMVIGTIVSKVEECESKELNLLIQCHNIHHSLLNFSLMQAVGSMQLFKQNCDNDRFDRFIYFLNAYYEKSTEKDVIFSRSGKNKELLENYLSQFNDIYDYCAKIYFLPTENYFTGQMKVLETRNHKFNSRWLELFENNAALINALLALGTQELSDSTSIKHYMLLAVNFWDAKERYFRLIDENK